MILSDKHHFVYLHIPKCAGTTIRMRLTRGEASFDRRFSDYVELPGTGQYHGAHLTLKMLRDHFPTEYDKVKAYDSVTVMRDPLVRFSSAFSQYQREFYGRNSDLLSPEMMRVELKILQERLQDGLQTEDTKLMHFLPQADFIELNGEKIVDTVYPLEKIDILAEKIRVRFGLLNLPSSENQRRKVRIKSLAKPLHFAKKFSRNLLPAPVYKILHQSAVATLTDAHNSSAASVSNQIRDFVEEYYARDFALYKKTQEIFNKL